MKSTTRGARSTLPLILVSVLLCGACNSEPEAQPDSEQAADGENALQQSDESGKLAAADACALDLPGIQIDTSSPDIDGALLHTFGGKCAVSNAVAASAAAVHRDYVNNNYCSAAVGIADAIGQGNMGVALKTLGDLVEQGQYDAEEAERLQLALSLCGDESVMTAAAAEYLADAQLRVYSLGTAEFNGNHCPTVVWSLTRTNQGELYHVAGLDQCVGIRLPHEQLFHPENNTEGQLPGDYIRQALRYNGVLPSHFNYQGNRYQFESDEILTQKEHDEIIQAEADRAILGEEAGRYIYWSSGEESVENDHLLPREAVPFNFHADSVSDLPPIERALVSLQRSYGAPRVVDVAQVHNGLQPGIHATVRSSSGDEFVMIVDAVDGMTATELLGWLPGTHAELLVVHENETEPDENLSLKGALFTDGTTTVSAWLKDCRCNTQGVLGWLAKDKLESGKQLQQLRKDFIARARTTAMLRHWTVSSELGPRSVGYVASGYTQSASENEATFVVHAGGIAHTLYVTKMMSCNNQSLLFSFGKNALFLPAECKETAVGGSAYTVLDTSSELRAAMQGGSRMKVGLVESGSDSVGEEFQFSLMGISRALDVVNADEAGMSAEAMSFFPDTPLSDATESKLFAQLEKRIEFCRSGLSPLACGQGDSMPAIAAAKPTVKAAAKPSVVATKPVRRSSSPPRDYVMGYANIVAEQLGSKDLPECTEVVGRIMAVARSGGAPDSRATEIDLLVGRAPGSCF